MALPASRNYLALSGFLFCFFFAQAMAMSLLSIWLSRTLGLGGMAVGTVFAANSVGAMCAQPRLDPVGDGDVELADQHQTHRAVGVGALSYLKRWPGKCHSCRP